MRFGITIGSKGPQLHPQALIDMKAIGLTDLRFQVPGSLIAPSPNTFNWGLWDDAVSKANAAGVNLTLTIKQLAPFMLGADGYPDPQHAASFASMIAGRYDGKSGNGKIDVLEMGNEDYNLSSTFAFAQLAAAMSAVYPAAKSANPDLIVTPGSLLQRNTANIKQAVDVLWQNAAGKFDALNFHFYTGIPGNGSIDPSDGSLANIPNFPQYVQAIQGVNASHGQPDFPIWCTEFGFPVTNSFGRDPRTIVTEAVQWSNLKYLYDQAASLGVDRMYAFTLGYATPSPDGMSLVQANGHQTLAYTGLKSYIAGGTPTPTPTPPPVPTPTPTSQVINLTNFTGTITITPSS